MNSRTETCLSERLARAYQDAYAVHGDLDLELTCFVEKLQALLKSHLGSAASTHCRLNLLSSLYSADLYVSIACAQANDAAWRRFLTLYAKRILRFAILITGNRNSGHDLADNLIADLFLPDCSGS